MATFNTNYILFFRNAGIFKKIWFSKITFVKETRESIFMIFIEFSYMKTSL